ncbi:MAG: hypothetical protein AAGC49_01055 [Brevundimonas sp.]
MATVLAVACVFVGASGASALPSSVPLAASFSNLMPGDSASKTWRLVVPQEARVSQAVLNRTGTGVVDWRARMCPTTGGTCVDLMKASVGTPIHAGTYELTVNLTVVELEQSETQSLEGRFTLVEAGGELAHTGAQVWSAALASVLAAGVGILLVLVARRRHRDPDQPDLTEA